MVFKMLVLTAISQGLLWAIMAIGVFITILDLAGLTAEGGLPLSAATTTIMIVMRSTQSLRL